MIDCAGAVCCGVEFRCNKLDKPKRLCDLLVVTEGAGLAAGRSLDDDTTEAKRCALVAL